MPELDQSLMLNERGAAEFLGVTSYTLLSWRRKKQGPTWVKVGKCVRYRRSDLEEFLKSNERKYGVTPA